MSVIPNVFERISFSFWVPVFALIVANGFFLIHAEQKRAFYQRSVSELSSGDVVFLEDVIDGDTIVVSKSGARTTIRLVGIKSFEPNSDQKSERIFAELAIEAIKRTLGNEAVTIITDGETDRSGKTIGRIVFNDTDLGERLLETGMVMLFPAYDFEERARYNEKQSIAINANQGFWQNSTLKQRTLQRQQAWRQLNENK